MVKRSETTGFPIGKALRSGKSARSCRMPSTHLSLHYHLIFSTKNREPWLAPDSRARVHEYLGGAKPEA